VTLLQCLWVIGGLDCLYDDTVAQSLNCFLFGPVMTLLQSLEVVGSHYYLLCDTAAVPER
jgi:hypothetical protein